MASRRDVLKSIGLLGLGAAALGSPLDVKSVRAQDGPSMPERWQGEPYARISQAYQNARAEPTTDSEIVQELVRDELVRVHGLVSGQWVFNNNDLWLQTKHGYLYASLVQPIGFHLPAQPVAELGDGRWGELIVPASDMYLSPDPADLEAHRGRVYYGSTFRVTALVDGADDHKWYRIRELYQTLYVPATHIRLIPDAELAPLSPDVPADEKHLVVDLPAQIITAYEYDEPVWAHRVSSGITGHTTPEGVHYIWDKRISERMVADTVSDDPDFYNLPGVPYVCYFTDNWVATHGTYWHNDYGRPRSHGCVNLPTYAARWIWRWTTPHPELSELYHQVNNRLDGTRVVVRA